MSLYSDAKSPHSMPFQSKNIWQLGFLLLGISALLRTAERFIYMGLHWNRVSNWSTSNWLYCGVLSLVSIVFAFLFLRYLTKTYSRTLVWASFTLTVLGSIGYLVVIVSSFIEGVPRIVPLLGDWFSILGMSGSPLSCILGPLMETSRTAYRFYAVYVVSADYVIKSVFLGMSIMKYSENGVHAAKPGLAYRAHA